MEQKLVSKKHDDFKRWQEHAQIEMCDVLGWENPDLDEIQRWTKLVEVLLTEESLNVHRTKKTFQWASQMAVWTRQTLAEIRATPVKNRIDELTDWLTEVFLSGCIEDVESVYLMIESWKDVDLSQHDIDGDEHRTLLKELRLINRYQIGLFDKE